MLVKQYYVYLSVLSTDTVIVLSFVALLSVGNTIAHFTQHGMCELTTVSFETI